MKKEILFFAPTKIMLERVRNLIKTHNIERVQAEFGDVNVAINTTEQYITKDTKVIISRGGTYTFFQKKYNLPVVEVKVDICDVINSYNKLEKKNAGTIGVVGFRNVIYGFEFINSFIKEPVKKIYLEDEKKALGILNEAISTGITTFLGDTAIKLVSNQEGIQTEIIDSRDEKILEAIEEAQLIVKSMEAEEKARKQTEALTDYIHDGVIVVSEKNIISVFNKEAERILSIFAQRVIGKKLIDVFPELDELQKESWQKPLSSILKIINGKEVLLNSVPIILNDELEGMVFSFKKPEEISELDHKIRRSRSSSGFIAKYTFQNISCKSDEMKKCISLAKVFAGYDSPILIYGKSGTGKEMICQSIHNESKRSNGPFVAVNCAAIPSNLIESELFGYEEGAFTGAKKNGKAGMFELAHNGTIFLDEISEMPYEFQGRLLRVIQEKQVVRVGGDKVIPIDVRVICASNKDLKKMMEEGKFREDLFFRINIIQLNIPSLSQRKGDIPYLADIFLEKYAIKYDKPKMTIPENIIKILEVRNYVGNVRELEGMMERCVILQSFDDIEPEKVKSSDVFSINENYTMSLKTVTQKYIEEVYRQNNFSTKKTCEILQIDRTTLWKKLKETT